MTSDLDQGTDLSTRRFSSVRPQDQVEDETQEHAPLSRRAVMISAGASGLALLTAFVAGAAGGTEGVDPELQVHQDRLAAARDDLRAAEAKTERLPDVTTGRRQLAAALESAQGVADLQNGYRYLAFRVGEDMTLDQALVEPVRRDLLPYFEKDLDPALLSPWYLLADDVSAPLGIGVPSSFRSGFSWQAQVPHEITQEARVPVIWLALPVSRGSAGGLDVEVPLAWASAEFDPVRRVFTDLRTGTTALGASRELEVLDEPAA